MSFGSIFRSGARKMARIQSPIGLDIGAVSPAEIAVAIMGQITARLRLPAEKAS